MNRSRVLGARARLQATRGRPEAADLVAGLVETLEAIEFPNIRVDGFVDAAEATALLGDVPRAVGYANEAVRLAEAKGNLTRARQIRTIIARIQRHSSAV